MSLYHYDVHVYCTFILSKFYDPFFGSELRKRLKRLGLRVPSFLLSYTSLPTYIVVLPILRDMLQDSGIFKSDAPQRELRWFLEGGVGKRTSSDRPVPIGQMVLTSAIVASSYCDDTLFFQHMRHRRPKPAHAPPLPRNLSRALGSLCLSKGTSWVSLTLVIFKGSGVHFSFMTN